MNDTNDPRDLPPRIEDIDLAELAEKLDAVFAASPPIGYVLGRTALRDAISADLRCSDLMAEEIVDTMVSRGLLHFEGDPTRPGSDMARWLIRRE